MKNKLLKDHVFLLPILVDHGKTCSTVSGYFPKTGFCVVNIVDGISVQFNDYLVLKVVTLVTGRHICNFNPFGDAEFLLICLG